MAEPPAGKSWAEINDEDRPELILTDSEVEVTHSDPANSLPVERVTTFEALGLRAELLKGITEGLKFNAPTVVQRTALPLLLRNPPEHMIAQSQSGTGKTAAFAICMLSRLDPAVRSPQALCVAPTRELAMQTYEVCTKMSQFMPGVAIKLVVKDAPLPDRSAPLVEQVIIGTPGKVNDIITRRNLPTGKDSRLRVVVFDEADDLFDADTLAGVGAGAGAKGAKNQPLAEQADKVRRMCPASAQFLLFSATFPDAVRAWADKTVPNPKNQLLLKVEELSVDKIQQLYVRCAEGEKAALCCRLYGHITAGQSIVFCNSIRSVKDVHRAMTDDGHTLSILHGRNMPSADRDAILRQFREGQTKVLITTNVLSRGIDIPQISLVVNFALPVKFRSEPRRVDAETYLHRIGRTGRQGRSGVAITLVAPEEEPLFEQLKKYYHNVKIEELLLDQLETIDTRLNAMEEYRHKP